MKVCCLKCFFSANSSDEQSGFHGQQKIIVCLFISFLSLSVEWNSCNQIKQKKLKKSSAQKITCITAIAEKKIISVPCVWGTMLPNYASAVQMKQFLPLGSFSAEIHNGKQKKLTNSTETVARRCSINGCSQKFRKIYRKTPVPETFNKVAGLRPATLLKESLAQVFSCEFC